MATFQKLNIGEVGLIQETEDGKIVQLALSPEQSNILQIIVASISKNSPLIRLGEEYELVLKSSVKTLI